MSHCNFKLAAFLEFHFSFQGNNEALVLMPTEELWEETKRFVFPWILSAEENNYSDQSDMYYHYFNNSIIIQLIKSWKIWCVHIKTDSYDYKNANRSLNRTKSYIYTCVCVHIWIILLLPSLWLSGGSWQQYLFANLCNTRARRSLYPFSWLWQLQLWLQLTPSPQTPISLDCLPSIFCFSRSEAQGRNL